MSFAALWREADKKRRREPKDARIARLRKLMADDVSLDRAWRELNERPQRAAESTVEALMFSLRSGIGALARPDSVRRLSELSDGQMREVAVCVQKFKPYIAAAWTAEDVRVLFVARSRVHER
jgi:hypothetical protein